MMSARYRLSAIRIPVSVLVSTESLGTNAIAVKIIFTDFQNLVVLVNIVHF